MGKGFAIAALVLGILGLFTAGGLVIGSLLGLVLASVALVRGEGRDVAWAGVAANLLALATVFPVGAAVWTMRASPISLWEREDDSLPEPVQPSQAFVSPAAGAAPPPPPPPPTTRPAAAARPKPAGAAETGLSAPVRVGSGIPEPRKTRNVSPVYPPMALQARVQGVVVLECTIGPEGKVTRVVVVSGPPLLTDAAVDAVRQWEYTPTLLAGVPVPVIMTVRVNFKLS